MKPRVISFIIPVLLFSIIPAYAEIGENFDRTQLDEKTFKWVSHYDRIWDGSQWVNYLWADTGNTITFQSTNLNFTLNKTSCNFKLAGLEGYEKSLSIDGLPVVLSNCNVTNINEMEDSLEIIITEDAPDTEFKTIFNLGAIGIEEWTYEISNKNILA